MKKKVLLGTAALAISMLLLPVTYTAPVCKAATTTAEEQTKETAKTAFDFATKTLKQGNVTAKYIQISNLSDAKKQKLINGILKTDAKAIVKTITSVSPDVKLDMDVSGKYIKDTNLFVVTYTGYYNFKKSAHPTNFCYESVIDINKASRMNYSDKAILSKLKNAIQNGKFKVNGKDSLVITALQEYLKNLSDKDLAAILKNFNFKYDKNSLVIPESFMYETKDSMELILPTLHVLGDYFKISIDTSNLK